MADAKELDLSRLEELRPANPKEDDSRLTIGVFNGAASLALFQGPPGAPKLKIPLRAVGFIEAIVDCLEKLIKAPPGGDKLEISYNEWDNEAKKANQVATMALFRTDKGTGALQISGGAIRSVTFPIRLPLGMEFTSLSEAERANAAIRGLITTLKVRLVISQLLTSFKRDRPYGGNRVGGGGGGGNNYNKSNSQQNSGTDDSIPF